MHDVEKRLWPACPDAKVRAYARAFGECADDLDLNFALARPVLVTRLLALCLGHENGVWSDGELWSWTLGQRLQGLLAIALAGEAAPLSIVASCAQCAERLEIEIDPAVFEREEPATAFDWSPTPDRQWRVRLPTGHEQQAWWQAGDISAEAMARRLVFGRENGVEHESLPSDWVETVGAQLAEYDPLTALEMETACPACAAEARIPLDLEAELLALLHLRQRRRLMEIHQLASAYHWSEAAIMQLPAWRRRYYLAQVAGGAA